MIRPSNFDLFVFTRFGIHCAPHVLCEMAGEHGVQAFIPPSTIRLAPVMYEDSELAINATIAAISSTCP